MFTGIIESQATIRGIDSNEGSNITFTVESSLTPELRIDQSVAHNGVCLTVTDIEGDCYKVTAVAETLAKTNLGAWQVGDVVNIERSLRAGDRIDGHFVQGHVDGTVVCTDKQTLDGSWLFTFRITAAQAPLVIEKGSICLNGVSLTVFNVGKEACSVTIIPYTYEHTNFRTVDKGSTVNVEFDVLGKYLLRRYDLQEEG